MEQHQVAAYIDQHRDRWLKKLFELLRIPSISADSRYRPQVRQAGEYCVEWLRQIGFENVGLKETKNHPVVYGDWLHAGNDKPTIMCYGHYDVQPTDPIEKWTSPPFEPVIRDEKIFARGADDNKGQLATQLCALETIFALNKKLPVNVKVLIEGEEESDGRGTFAFVEEHRDFLACDAIAISDSPWFDANTPSLCYSLRGTCALEVKVRGPERDLHSGSYGGYIQNPLNAAAKIIAKLQDERGKILVPGYYDDVVPLTDEERAEFHSVGVDEEQLKRELGVATLWGEEGYTAVERNWARPTLDVCGLWGGYAGEGNKSVIPAEAGFKINSRVVANQKPERCVELITNYIKSVCPPGVRADVKTIAFASPMMVSRESPYLQAAMKAFERTFGKRPKLTREGATIPITALFLSALKAPSILVGHGLLSDVIHSPNENFPLDQLFKGIRGNIALYEEFAHVLHQ
ncbi:MAG: dipeptidase [Deltaproteobacteria bacterium]|nr:dipeptidase [Deltaproteobacteria bacterium]